ncbi:MAG: FG-GAP-like repeat-containing protein [Candidatus Neomarinimicrobiota bacterium]
MKITVPRVLRKELSMQVLVAVQILFFAIDLDGDNDLDIVCGTYNTSILYWFKNDGFQSFTRYTIASGGTTTPVPIDLDEDGDIDIVSRFNDGSNVITWFENNGSESFTGNSIDNIQAGNIEVIDLDEDGDYDLVVPDLTNDHLTWYANNGSESFTKNTIDNSGMIDIYDVEVGDIDGDGDLDIAAQTASDNNTSDDKIVWYANNGSESFTEYDVDTDLSYPYRFNLVDIDGDGDLDMVTAARQGDEVVWYENVDGGYTLGVSLSGSATGAEVLSVSPASNAIYDVAGNVASTSQYYNTAYLNDKTGPTMTITASNGMVIINDGSTTNNSSLSLTLISSETTSNFAVGDITVSGGSVSSFSGSGTTYYATFTPSASGATTIDVAGSTFTDAAGNNNSAASQFNWTYDGTLPTITGVSLTSDNSTIAVTFSEAVYNTAGGSGSLQTSDFVFSISGGSATLSSSTPSSISVSSNTYTLGISLSGTANGSETLTVNPASSAIYDVVGNTASTSQSNNTASLNSANYVLDLDGSNEAAYVGDNSAFESTDFSIQVWVDPSSLPSSGNEAWFVNKNRVYRIGLKNNSGTTKIIAEHRSGGSYEDIEGSTLSDANGGWYHVVFTFDDSSNRLRIYVNGSEIDEESYSGSTVNQNSEFSIGRRHDTNGGYFHGKIDEVAYWDTELSANAISALYNSGSPLSASTNSGNYSSSANLVMYYQFQEDLNDSEGSFNLTGRNITSSDYTAETID